MIHEKSCGAIVFIKNRVRKYLLLQYKAGHWDFVKGINVVNESEKETAMRELTEETGIKNAHFVGDFREEIHYFFRRKGRLVSKKVAYFLIEASESAVNISYEHVGYEWLGFQSAMEKLTFENARKVLESANKFLKNVKHNK